MKGDLDVAARGGRGGGGFRGGGSRFGSRSGSRMSGTRYGGGMRSSSGMRWGSFGAGMVAYGAMSSLARIGHGGHYGYNRMYYPNHHPSKFIKFKSLTVVEQDFKTQ